MKSIFEGYFKEEFKFELKLNANKIEIKFFENQVENFQKLFDVYETLKVKIESNQVLNKQAVLKYFEELHKMNQINTNPIVFVRNSEFFVISESFLILKDVKIVNE